MPDVDSGNPPSLHLLFAASAAFVVAINCWSVTMASRTQITLTFVKMFALVLIIVPGVVALAKGGRAAIVLS